MSDPKFQDFEIPSKLLNELYELTGGKEAFKGFIIAFSTEKGTPVVYTKCDSQITEYGLMKSLNDYLAEYNTDPQEIEEE